MSSFVVLFYFSSSFCSFFFFLSSIFTNQRFTGTFAKENGGGFLTDHFPKATKACWDIEGVYCSSRYVCYFRVYFIFWFSSTHCSPKNFETQSFLFVVSIFVLSHIPGVRFAGLIHPGLIGTAPSPELLKMWNDREATLVSEEGTEKEKTLCGCLATRPLACLPEPKGAMLGKLGHFKDKMDTDETWTKVAKEAARTVPGRENGGNVSENLVC